MHHTPSAITALIALTLHSLVYVLACIAQQDHVRLCCFVLLGTPLTICVIVVCTTALHCTVLHCTALQCTLYIAMMSLAFVLVSF